MSAFEGRDLSGQVAWVTGGGSGIGRAAAEALAGAGVTVVVSGRRQSALDEVVAGIEAAGGKAEAQSVTVDDAQAVAALAAHIAERRGRLDILVNSAGINVPDRRWAEMAVESWDRVVATDLNGAFYCARAVLPIMRERRDGLLIHISSWAGRYDTYLTGPAYNAAKHGLNAMSASLNMDEFKHGIRSCVICPGEVATPIIDKRPIPVPEEERARMLQAEDLGRIVLHVAQMDPRVCINEIVVSPTWNRLSAGNVAG